jgi:hypothetical protein
VQAEPQELAPATADSQVASETTETQDNEPLPDPPAEPTGILGLGAKMVRKTTADLAENERVKNTVQYLADKSKVVTESERVQQSVQYVKDKTTQIVESERVQKGLEIAKEKAQIAQEKASEVTHKVSEKTKAAVEFAKDKTQGIREGAANVWSAGRGSIQRARASVSS